MHNSLTYHSVLVKIISASGVPAGDIEGTSDPYIVIHLDKDTRRTSVKKRTLSPCWNQEFKYAGVHHTKVFKVDMFDKDAVGADDLLGYGEFRFSEVENGVPTKVVVPMSIAEGTHSPTPHPSKRFVLAVEITPQKRPPQSNEEEEEPEVSEEDYAVLLSAYDRHTTLSDTNHIHTDAQVVGMLQDLGAAQQHIPENVIEKYDSTRSGRLQFQDFLKLVIDLRKKSAQERDTDTLEAWIALGGSIDTNGEAVGKVSVHDIGQIGHAFDVSANALFWDKASPTSTVSPDVDRGRKYSWASHKSEEGGELTFQEFCQYFSDHQSVVNGKQQHRESFESDMDVISGHSTAESADDTPGADLEVEKEKNRQNRLEVSPYFGGFGPRRKTKTMKKTVKRIEGKALQAIEQHISRYQRVRPNHKHKTLADQTMYSDSDNINPAFMNSSGSGMLPPLKNSTLCSHMNNYNYNNHSSNVVGYIPSMSSRYDHFNNSSNISKHNAINKPFAKGGPISPALSGMSECYDSWNDDEPLVEITVTSLPALLYPSSTRNPGSVGSSGGDKGADEFGEGQRRGIPSALLKDLQALRSDGVSSALSSVLINQPPSERQHQLRKDREAGKAHRAAVKHQLREVKLFKNGLVVV